MATPVLTPLEAVQPLLHTAEAPARRWSPRSLLVLFAAWAVLQFSGIFSPGLLDDVDSVYVEVAREMLQRHDYVTPYADGIRFFDKPPLMYWLAAGSMKVFGVYDWAARLPLALLVLALLFAVYALGVRLFGKRGGFYSALAVATSIGPYLFTRFFIPDILLALWMTLSVHLFLRMLDQIESNQTASRINCWGFALVMALNVLTKGLIGLVFPVGVVLVYLLATRQLRLLARMRLASSIFVFLAAAAPWHVLAALRNPAVGAARGWFWFYIVNEHFMRFLGKRIPHDYGQVPLLAFWALLALWLVPWAAFLPGAIRTTFQAIVHRTWVTAQEHRAALVLTIWALVVLGFFSLSSRQEYYSLPALPALALMAGGLLAREEKGDPIAHRSALSANKWLVLPLFLLISAVCGFFAIWSPRPPAGADIFSLLQQHPEDYTLSLGHFFDLTGAAMGLFRVPLAGVAIAMLAGALGSYMLRERRRFLAANLVLAAAMGVNLLCAHQGLAIFYPTLGCKPLAVAIHQVIKPGDMILLDGEFTSGSSINFYTQQQVHLVNGRMNGTWYGSFWPDAPHIFETDATLHHLWQGPQRLFLLTTDPSRAADLAPYGRVSIFATAGGKTILTNQPN